MLYATQMKRPSLALGVTRVPVSALEEKENMFFLHSPCNLGKLYRPIN